MTRFRAVALQLFKTKSPDLLIAEPAAPERQMKRTLGPCRISHHVHRLEFRQIVRDRHQRGADLISDGLLLGLL